MSVKLVDINDPQGAAVFGRMTRAAPEPSKDGRGRQVREASFRPATANAESRTVELVWTTGASVKRWDWWRECEYLEVLEVSDKAIRLDRLNSGAPVLTDHWASIEHQVGVVEKAWIEGTEGKALVRFASDEKSDLVFRKVMDGILRNISVGYEVHDFTREKDENGTQTYMVTDWEPMEISLVAVPADAGAGVRANGGAAPRNGGRPAKKQRSAAMLREELIKMFVESGMTQAQAEAAADAAISAAADTTDGQTDGQNSGDAGEQRNRPAPQARAASARELRTLARSVGVADDVVDELVDAGATIEVAREKILAAVAQRQASTQTAGPRTTIVRDEAETRAARVGAALSARIGRTQATDEAREYMGLSFGEIAREFVPNSRSMSRAQVIGEALRLRGRRAAGSMHSTDFAGVLGGVLDRTLRTAYENAGQTFRPFVRETTVQDARLVERYQVSSFPALEKIEEGGEYTTGSMSEAKESFRVEKWGKKVILTDVMLINDDMGAIQQMIQTAAGIAADKESDLVYGILNDNPKMADGKALFHSDHKNTGAAGVDVAGLSALRAMALAQKSPLDKRGRVANVVEIAEQRAPGM